MKLRADFHSHSHFSKDSLINPRTYIDTCVRKGVTCIAVTDHNAIDGAFVIEKLARDSSAPIKVIIGEEVKTSEGEIIGLFLKEFVGEGITWAHLDLAGPAFNASGPCGYTPKGGTGSAVRTLVRVAELAASGDLG